MQNLVGEYLENSVTGWNKGLVARDLIDFYRRWPEFREVATQLSERPDLNDIQRETIWWMIQLVDRIGRHDLEN